MGMQALGRGDHAEDEKSTPGGRAFLGWHVEARRKLAKHVKAAAILASVRGSCLHKVLVQWAGCAKMMANHTALACTSAAAAAVRHAAPYDGRLEQRSRSQGIWLEEA